MTHFCFQVETDAALPQTSSSQDENSDCCHSLQQTYELTDESTRPDGTPGDEVNLSPEEGAGSSEAMENLDEDDLPTEQTFNSVNHDSKPSPAVLREIDRDGNEIIISDHRTSAGFTFRNTLMFELD